MIKPIETIYKGYRFRSRLEARWAVFFDEIGLKWEYEKEGFDVDGKWYLPDFYLPFIDAYVEIKPTSMYPIFLTKIADELQKKFLIICGQPYLDDYHIELYLPINLHEDHYPDNPIYCVFSEDRRDDGIYWLTNTESHFDCTTCLQRDVDGGCRNCDAGDCYFAIRIVDGDSTDHDRWPVNNTRNMIDAYKKARQSRFEHGECR
jgi:hypothetical protein